MTNCNVAMDKATSNSKGFGFVQFSTHQEAEAAKTSMDRYQLPGHNQQLIVEYAQRKTPVPEAAPPVPSCFIIEYSVI